MAEKRYYWLKLKEDFFNDIRMKRLRKISAGSTYTIIYLKLLLLSLKDEGKLYFERVDDTFIQELSLIIDETEDDIMLTLQYLQKVGLLEVISNEHEDDVVMVKFINKATVLDFIDYLMVCGFTGTEISYMIKDSNYINQNGYIYKDEEKKRYILDHKLTLSISEIYDFVKEIRDI